MQLNNERLNLLALSLLGIRIQREFVQTGSLQCADEFLGSLSTLQRRTVSAIEPVYGTCPFKAAEKIAAICLSKNYRIILHCDDDYPPLLKEIPDPPLAIYTTGVLPGLRSVAIVGTRKGDTQSIHTARRLAQRFAEHGLSVISGLAIGIDRAAHEGALDVDGSTLGVLGGGIDTVYPGSNRDIYFAINRRENCQLLSEFPPGISVKKWSFVKRNRIISGLSEAVVVVKAGSKSGALITADFALEQNRELFACCSQPFQEEFAGCIALVNQGAYCIYDENTVFDVLKIRAGYIEKGVETEGDENSIVKYIRSGVHDIDELIRTSGMDQSLFRQQLTELEISSVVHRAGNRLYLGKVHK